ncbi:hypothetical protein GJ496_010538 [Pomphorhynchus laevis]|nr:hypothetical protein GJ496_010538 [Pomphorhynchus laevis]
MPIYLHTSEMHCNHKPIFCLKCARSITSLYPYMRTHNGRCTGSVNDYVLSTSSTEQLSNPVTSTETLSSSIDVQTNRSNAYEIIYSGSSMHTVTCPHAGSSFFYSCGLCGISLSAYVRKTQGNYSVCARYIAADTSVCVSYPVFTFTSHALSNVNDSLTSVDFEKPRKISALLSNKRELHGASALSISSSDNHHELMNRLLTANEAVEHADITSSGSDAPSSVKIVSKDMDYDNFPHMSLLPELSAYHTTYVFNLAEISENLIVPCVLSKVSSRRSQMLLTQIMGEHQSVDCPLTTNIIESHFMSIYNSTPPLNVNGPACTMYCIAIKGNVDLGDDKCKGEKVGCVKQTTDWQRYLLVYRGCTMTTITCPVCKADFMGSYRHSMAYCYECEYCSTILSDNVKIVQGHYKVCARMVSAGYTIPRGDKQNANNSSLASILHDNDSSPQLTSVASIECVNKSYLNIGPKYPLDSMSCITGQTVCEDNGSTGQNLSSNISFDSGFTDNSSKSLASYLNVDKLVDKVISTMNLSNPSSQYGDGNLSDPDYVPNNSLDKFTNLDRCPEMYDNLSFLPDQAIKIITTELSKSDLNNRYFSFLSRILTNIATLRDAPSINYINYLMFDVTSYFRPHQVRFSPTTYDRSKKLGVYL